MQICDLGLISSLISAEHVHFSAEDDGARVLNVREAVVEINRSSNISSCVDDHAFVAEVLSVIENQQISIVAELILTTLSIRSAAFRATCRARTVISTVQRCCIATRSATKRKTFSSKPISTVFSYE